MFLKKFDFAVEFGLRLGLWVIFGWLDQITPFIRHIDEEELWYYRYPSVDPIVPKIWLYAAMVGVPAVVYLLQYLLSKDEKSTIENILTQLSGLSLAYCINGVFSTLLKVVIGRPRPNFFLRCFPDGYGTNIDDCTGEYEGHMDGRKSFPSAHSSFAFTGMVFLTLHIFELVDFHKHFFARGFVFILALMPLLLASLIAVSRTCDYHHHYSDVIGGSLLGTIIAVTVYFTYSKVEDDDDETEKK